MFAGILISFLAIHFSGENWVNDWIRPWGKIFIKALVLIAVPLVFLSLIKGITELKDTSLLSKLGGRTIVLYLMTTVFAVCIGLGTALLIQPGKIISDDMVTQITTQYAGDAQTIKIQQQNTNHTSPLSFLEEVVPGNIFQALSNNGKMLQIIFFAVLFGIATLSIPSEKKELLVKGIDALNEVILRIVEFIIRLAPLGVAALMAGLVVDFNGNATIFVALGIYALNVVVGLLFLLLIFYPILVRTFAKIAPLHFIRQLYPLQLFAFTTSSSSATLPMTFATAEKKLGISSKVTSFVLPIGATINMDGTSCYQTIATLCIAQALGIDLTFIQILTIVVMTTLSSIGTPGIPGGSYVILAMVLTSIGIPAESLALILGIDRPLDMLRTSVNVTGDVAVASIINKRLPK